MTLLQTWKPRRDRAGIAESHRVRTDIAKSTKISPPEKKRRISETGLVILNALKDLTGAHNEELYTVFAASQDEHSEISNNLKCSTEVLFSKLGQNKALSVLLSERSRLALLESVREPDWMYLLLKIRLPISDTGWQTLISPTHLGRTGVGYN